MKQFIEATGSSFFPSQDINGLIAESSRNSKDASSAKSVSSISKHKIIFVDNLAKN